MTIWKNAGWNLIGNLLYVISQWLVIVCITKAVGVENLGIYSLALSIVTPIFLFLNFQLRSILATDISQEYDINDYFRVRHIMNLVAFISISLFAVVVVIKGSNLLAWVVILLAVQKSIESYTELIYGYYQRIERMSLIAASLFLRSSSYFLIFVPVLIYSENFPVALLSSTVAFYFIYKLIDRRRIDIPKLPKQNLRKFGKLIRTGLQLGFVNLFLTLNENFPRYIIQLVAGSFYLGTYSAITYLKMPGTILVNTTCQAAVSRMAGEYKALKINKMIRLLTSLLLLSILIGIVGVFSTFWGKSLLALVYSEEVSGYSDIFTIVMISAGVGYVNSVLGYGITSARKFSIQPILSGSSLVLTIISSGLLIPLYGIKGAAIASLIVSISQMIMLGTCVVIYTRKLRSE